MRRRPFSLVPHCIRFQNAGSHPSEPYPVPLTLLGCRCQVEELVEDAKASGARVVAGGNRFSPNGKNGYFYEPTILADVQEGVRIVDEEQFGPVMPLIKYSDVDDALVTARHSLPLADSLPAVL